MTKLSIIKPRKTIPVASSISSQVSIDQRPAKQPKTSQQASPSSSSHIISFDNSSSSPAASLAVLWKYKLRRWCKPILGKPEPKRLLQRAKADKASVLGDASKYLKYLQELVKTLEEQAAKVTIGICFVRVKKSSGFVLLMNSSSSTDENSAGGCRDYPLPENRNNSFR
ncbi:hypothetical protein NC653_013425 [Populus alba x Populus x berolinensis]|uniref:Uncharacterized protein n=1 Tax=Populus alba x Populus x berolinensis TaxID=444605 RepID=A0AAD6W2G6_9ROSI|nr:hypothetical protein NC653_013425 [Populus alba x Populus x berolinensis]